MTEVQDTSGMLPAGRQTRTTVAGVTAGRIVDGAAHLGANSLGSKVPPVVGTIMVRASRVPVFSDPVCGFSDPSLHRHVPVTAASRGFRSGLSSQFLTGGLSTPRHPNFGLPNLHVGASVDLSTECSSGL